MGTITRQKTIGILTIRLHTTRWNGRKLCHFPFVPFVVFPSLGTGPSIDSSEVPSRSSLERDCRREGCWLSEYILVPTNVSCVSSFDCSVPSTKTESANGCRRRSGGEIGQFCTRWFAGGGNRPTGMVGSSWQRGQGRMERCDGTIMSDDASTRE